MPITNTDRHAYYTMPFGSNELQTKIVNMTSRLTNLYTTVKPLLEDENEHTLHYVRNILCQDVLDKPMPGSFDVSRLNKLSRTVQKLDSITEDIQKAWSESEITRYIRMKATDDWQRVNLYIDDFSIQLQQVNWKKVGFIYWVLAGQPDLRATKIVQRALLTHISREYHIISDDKVYYEAQVRYMLGLLPSGVRRKDSIINVNNPDDIFHEALISRSPLKKYDVTLGLRKLDDASRRPIFSAESN